jgi:hypothetical protein
MSEQNILNPTVGDNLNPDYSYTEGLPNMMSSFQAKSGSVVTRQMLARGRVYDLQWQNRPKTTADALRTWEAQYRADFFSYFDQERGRYFSGRFAAPPQISPAGFNKWNIQAQFVEIPGLPMFQYPALATLATVGTIWQSDAIFIEERDGFGNNLVKLTGAWVYRNDALGQHGGACFISSSIGDTAECIYFGYGFRSWAPTRSDSGKVTVFVDGVLSFTEDQYSAVNQNAKPLDVWTPLPLGIHRIKFVVAAKNPASSSNNSYFDALEVMQ